MPNQELHSLGAKEHKPTAKHWWATKASHLCWQQAKEGPKSLCPAQNHLYIGVMCPGQDVAVPEPRLPICSTPQCSIWLPAFCFGATAGSAVLHQTLPMVISWPHINQETTKKQIQQHFNAVRLFVPLSWNNLQLTTVFRLAFKALWSSAQILTKFNVKLAIYYFPSPNHSQISCTLVWWPCRKNERRAQVFLS